MENCIIRSAYKTETLHERTMVMVMVIMMMMTTTLFIALLNSVAAFLDGLIRRLAKSI